MTPGQSAWANACRALDLLAANPTHLRGLTLRARSGPVRDIFLDALTRRVGPIRKLHPAMPRDALLGGLDFAETLATGQLRERPGLLDQPGTLLLTMAERCPPELAALIAAKLDENRDLTLIALDEGAEPDETAPPSLTERLAFHVSLDTVGRLEAKPPPHHRPKNILGERERVSPSRQPRRQCRRNPAIEDLTRLAARLGIDTLRLPQLAVHAARANAVLHGQEEPDTDDIRTAAELVLAPAPAICRNRTNSSQSRRMTAPNPNPRARTNPCPRTC